MIKNFEKQSKPLTEYERDTLLPVIYRGLLAKVGEKMAITNAAITRGMKRAGYRLTEERLRKIINHIRVNGMIKCLIATSKGYYIATTRQEMEDYITSLQNRADSILAVKQALEKQQGSLTC